MEPITPVSVFTPVQPMLAGSQASVSDAWACLGSPARVAVEAHIRGRRIQIHREGEIVRVYDDAGEDITSAVPAVVEAAGAVDADRLVADAVIAGTRVHLFDVLLIDDEQVTGLPLSERTDLLAERVPVRFMIQRTITEIPVMAEAFTRHILDQGGSGVVLKDLDSPYVPGGEHPAWVLVRAGN